MTPTNLLILQGKTFERTLRWETAPIIYKEITAISKSAPARLTVVGHDIPDQWRAAVVSVEGMCQINAAHAPPTSSDFRKVTVVDVDTIEFNDLNSSEFEEYTKGGYLQYNTPADLAGFTARMSIKTGINGEEILLLTTENGRILIDDVAKTIALTIDALTTAGLTQQLGAYDLELVSPTGDVTQLLFGYARIVREVTT